MPNLTVATIVMKDRANVLIAKAIEGPDAGLWTIPDGLVGDGESVRNAAIRSVKEQTGLDVEPKMTLFLCERVAEGDHRVGIFILAEPVGITKSVPGQLADLKDIDLYGDKAQPIVPGNRYSEVKWADVRQLGEVQKNEGMSDFTAEAFVKFSNFLKSQAGSAGSSGRVN